MGAIIVNRPKLRFSRGVGVDDLMDEITARKAGKQPRRRNPKTEEGVALNSPKEHYYYRIFRKYFPKGYENLTARWDPFK